MSTKTTTTHSNHAGCCHRYYWLLLFLFPQTTSSSCSIILSCWNQLKIQLDNNSNKVWSLSNVIFMLLLAITTTTSTYALQDEVTEAAAEEEEIMFSPSSSSTSASVCPGDNIIPFDVTKHKKTTFIVGVLAIRGEEEAIQEFNSTWNSYLTATAGRRFDPPNQFDMKPLNFTLLFTDIVYVNPSAYSCIESEFSAHSLASQISRRVVKNHTYDLNKFGGVIMTRADNTDITTIHDITGKTVAAASISGLGSGQMQFLEMQKAGMSYINDPGQLVFTSNQGKVVEGVLQGEFDVGFVRTDQIEGSTFPNGTSMDPSWFKILNPQEVYLDDGSPFPFTSSTPLYPEWNVAALSHVHVDIQLAVQQAMLALGDHAEVATLQEECWQQQQYSNSTFQNDTASSLCPFDQLPRVRCDTTLSIAQLAQEARTLGAYKAWSPTLSYMQLRSMQDLTGFIALDPKDDTFKCTRTETLYDSIVCPSGYYKASPHQVDLACQQAGLQCADDYQCLCSPCLPIIQCTNGISLQDGTTCLAYSTLLPSILVPLFVVMMVLVHLYVEYRRQQADAVWSIDPDEIQISEPLEIIGRGTFGYVLLAEYRGTKVAIKKVLPPKTVNKKDRNRGKRRTSTDVANNKSASDGPSGPDTSGDVETPPPPHHWNPTWRDLPSNLQLWEETLGDSLDVNPGLQSMAPKLNSWTNSLGINSKSKHKQLKRNFIREMRHLSKLRHPCITTVMGAVVSVKSEPMLVMEFMTRGSLYDVLRDKTIKLDIDENLLPILQDIAQGMRFLHAASPQVIHGDLKSKNVLIDSNFRAKVTDFGLSAKRRNIATGTPFWMSPELLRGECHNNARSDVYAFGILLWEVYCRENPYSGENHLEVLQKVCDPVIRKRPVMPPNCPYKMRELYMNCVAHDPKQRPTAENIDMFLRVEGSVKERTTRLEKLNKELEAANRKIAEAQKTQLEHFAYES